MKEPRRETCATPEIQIYLNMVGGSRILAWSPLRNSRECPVDCGGILERADPDEVSVAAWHLDEKTSLCRRHSDQFRAVRGEPMFPYLSALRAAESVGQKSESLILVGVPRIELGLFAM